MSNGNLTNPWDEDGALASNWSYDNAEALSTPSVGYTQEQISSKIAQPITTSEQWLFIDTLIKFGGPVAKANRLPPAAMVACAIEESGYGTSSIYLKTGCPFNLQRPDWYTWVHCNTTSIKTCVKTNDKNECIDWKNAPFCVAAGNDEWEKLADSARIWCEWIMGWPQKKVRETMLSLRDTPEEFTRNLPLVGFGEQSKRTQNSQKFLGALQRHNLVARCASML